MVQSNLQSVNKIVANLREFSEDIKDISGGNKKEINRIVRNFDVAILELKESMLKMNELLEKANNGQGPLAKLVSDKEMG
ncbi:MAG TPA: hypothetical protein DIT19_02390, partial [Desulfonauticus sp.]|nr:hypothetical protein [Desulfonauticus sp.]